MKDVRTIVLWLAGCLLYTNEQRPGAIANLTIDQYKKGKISVEGRSSYFTIAVSKHKTGTTGSARITANSTVHRLLQDYVQHLRPLLTHCTRLKNDVILCIILYA